MRNSFVLHFGFVVILVAAISCKKHPLPTAPGDPEPPDTSHTSPPPPPVKLEETEPPVLTGVTDSVSDNIGGYYASLPKRYYESTETYPLLIDFHGGGQYGNGGADLLEVLKIGIPKLISEQKFPPSFTVGEEKFSFIVIAPQLKKQVANVEVLNLLTYVMEKYRVDTNRIYLSGFSLGGRTAANYGSLRPEKFAAMVTFGGLVVIDDELQAKCQNMIDTKLPVWHFHNRDDSAWAYSEAEAYIGMFNSLSPQIPARFTTFDVGEGKDHHDCWTRTVDPAYKEDSMNIYEWMLQYKKDD